MQWQRGPSPLISRTLALTSLLPFAAGWAILELGEQECALPFSSECPTAVWVQFQPLIRMISSIFWVKISECFMYGIRVEPSTGLFFTDRSLSHIRYVTLRKSPMRWLSGERHLLSKAGNLSSIPKPKQRWKNCSLHKVILWPPHMWIPTPI